MTKKQLWESKLAQRSKSITESYGDMASATTADGKKVMATGSTRHTRTYNYEDVTFRFGNTEGTGTYRWMNRPWQRFDFASALQSAMIDAGVDKEFARECIDKNGSLRSAVEYFAKNYKIDKKEIKESQQDSELLDAVMDAFGFTESEALKYIKKASEGTKRALVKGFKQDAKKNFYGEEKENKLKVGSFEFCVMDKYGNNIDCFEVEEDAIMFAKKKSNADRVLLVKYGPEDEYKDRPELSAETIWSVNDNEDDDEIVKEEVEEKKHQFKVNDRVICKLHMRGHLAGTIKRIFENSAEVKLDYNNKIIPVNISDLELLDKESFVKEEVEENKTYQIKYWLTEEDREEGFSDIFIDSFDSKQKAIMTAKKMVDRGDVASVEVFDAEDVTEQPVYFYDGNEENNDSLKEEKDLEEARGPGKGQKLDKFFRLVVNLYKDNLTKEEIAKLEKAKAEVERFEPTSEYEKKDKKNLLQQIEIALKDGSEIIEEKLYTNKKSLTESKHEETKFDDIFKASDKKFSKYITKIEDALGAEELYGGSILEIKNIILHNDYNVFNDGVEAEYSFQFDALVDGDFDEDEMKPHWIRYKLFNDGPAYIGYYTEYGPEVEDKDAVVMDSTCYYGNVAIIEMLQEAGYEPVYEGITALLENNVKDPYEEVRWK